MHGSLHIFEELPIFSDLNQVLGMFINGLQCWLINSCTGFALMEESG